MMVLENYAGLLQEGLQEPEPPMGQSREDGDMTASEHPTGLSHERGKRSLRARSWTSNCDACRLEVAAILRCCARRALHSWVQTCTSPRAF